MEEGNISCCAKYPAVLQPPHCPELILPVSTLATSVVQ